MISLLQGDARHIPLVDGCVQTVVTSPPYWALRDYGVNGQIGLESTPKEYIEKLVIVFREVWRVLRPDGTVWLNLGDSYNGSGKARGGGGLGPASAKQITNSGAYFDNPTPRLVNSLKPKDLIGIPWRVALALQADGWYLRSDIIWSKPNPMPESVTDRPTRSHEYLFLLTKQVRYFYNAEAIKESAAYDGRKDTTIKPAEKYNGRKMMEGQQPQQLGRGIETERWPNTFEDGTRARNRRTVWNIPTQPFSGAHFACFPEALVEPCILAGSRPDDLVFDPFMGTATVGKVALKHRRSFVGLDLKWDYIQLARQRTLEVQPYLNAT